MSSSFMIFLLVHFLFCIIQKWQRRFFILYEHGLLRYALDEMVSKVFFPLTTYFFFFLMLYMHRILKMASPANGKAIFRTFLFTKTHHFTSAAHGWVKVATH